MASKEKGNSKSQQIHDLLLDIIVNSLVRISRISLRGNMVFIRFWVKRRERRKRSLESLKSLRDITRVTEKENRTKGNNVSSNSLWPSPFSKP